MISNSVNLILKNDLAFDDSFPILFEKNYKEIKSLKHFNNNSNIKKENLNNFINKNKILFKICKDFSKIKYHNQVNFTKIDENNDYKTYKKNSYIMKEI